MDHDDAFLQHILEHPDDLAPRLIYADWLEEHGRSERAEFIRVQIELTEAEEYSPRWRELLAREYKLLKTRKKEWAEPFKGLAPHVRFYRGFVEQVSMFAGSFRQRADRLFRLAPLRQAKLSLASGTAVVPFDDLASSPYLARLRGLDLSGLYEFGNAAAQTLATSPYLSGVTDLNLNRCQIGRAGLEALAASSELSALRTLDLGNNHLDLGGLRALGSSTHLNPLTALSLSSNPFGTVLGNALLDLFRDAPAWGQLRSLDLGGQGLDDDGLTTLAGETCLTQLLAFNLSGNRGIGNLGVETLAHAPALGNLRKLSLHDCPAIGDPAAQALADSPFLRQLNYLDLGKERTTQARITDVGAEAIAASPHLSQLGYLNLKGNPVGKEMQKRLRKRFGTGVCTFSQQ
jgi:uncharacterized protein (TIGR02996 family)